MSHSLEWRTMNGHNCYKLRIIWTATGTSEKCWSPQLLIFYRILLKVSFNRYFLDCLSRVHAISSVICVFAEYVDHWNIRKFVHRCFTHYLSPIASAENFFGCTFKEYGTLVPSQTFIICLIPCHAVWKHLLNREKSIPNTAFGYFILFVCFVNVIKFNTNTSQLCI